MTTTKNGRMKLMERYIAPQPNGNWLILEGGGPVDMGNGVIGMPKKRIIATCFNEQEAQRLCAANDLLAALQMSLAYMTNVNSYEPSEVAATVIKALRKAGMDDESLDDAAMALMSGACRMR